MDTNYANLEDLNDKVESLHRRLDKFYEWAAILQKEFRDMKSRQMFLESQCNMEFSMCSQCTLQERLNDIKKSDT